MYSPGVAQSIVGFSKNRPHGDFYPTPPEATLKLLDVEAFTGTIWEPACGQGHISKVLAENGHDVVSTDLYDRGYGVSGVDFLRATDKTENIITNPPYRWAQAFAERSVMLASRKVALLLKLTYLEGKERQKFFKEFPPKTVYVFSGRLTMHRNGESKGSGGMIAYAWFVWEKGYLGDTIVKWI